MMRDVATFETVLPTFGVSDEDERFRACSTKIFIPKPHQSSPTQMLGNTVSAAVASGFATARALAITYYEEYTEVYATELHYAKVPQQPPQNSPTSRIIVK